MVREHYQDAVRRRGADAGRELRPGRGAMGVMGFSAGGHLGASVLAHPEEDELTQVPRLNDSTESYSARPDFGVLLYPVISMDRKVTHHGSKKNLLNASTPALAKYYSIETQVGPSSTPASSSPPTVFPPTFLYHSEEDATVPIENSILLAAALRKANVGAGRHDRGGDGGR
ncbi:hypothetical protein NSK_005699 [Nannochloropsis salina CCMP1776]|uniref:BD-FAE-like domain-containing protein n=1 Tax=Nannochloropsis salina CCMP1776 TaxID=1027361 RepID=A0A4D9CUN3_9STRA|nr:hypothetical protein NSK_005699 [Nannochloropsis salina CCMP1776]|eukprot:TFJ83011.1 hypothetical protein NSK_005699 [Nannochloropsis salina CCMP1776]